MHSHFREALIFLKQQYEWLAEMKSVVSETEQKCKILYEKLKKEIENEMEEVHAMKNNELFHENNLKPNELIKQQRYSNDDELDESMDYFEDSEAEETVNEVSEIKKSNLEIMQQEKPFESVHDKEAVVQTFKLGLHADDERQKLHKCKTCGKGFCRKGNLNQHEITHLKNKPFKCSYCHKSFARKETLMRHIGIHRPTATGEKPFKCALCPVTFSHFSSYTRHMRIHIAEKPHKCTTCGASFLNIKQLKIHEMEHTGEKPFGCIYCSELFMEKSLLIKHFQTHTNGRFKCIICHVTFAYQSGLDTHWNQQHLLK